MSKMSLADKLKVLVDVTSSSGMFIVAILLLLSLAYLFITTNKNNKATTKKIFLTIYGILIVGIIIFYGSSLADLFDYMMNNFFIVLYFPNLAIYFAAIITTNIILWISIFNQKITKWIKGINTVIFCIIHYLLIVIINVITTNKLDIFSQTSIYQNKEAQALIELSSSLFILWILFLLVYKLIRFYQQKNSPLEELETKPVTQIIEVEKEVPRKLPDNIKELEAPFYVRGKPKKTPVKEKTKPDIITQALDGMLTLQDYKLLLSILKMYQEQKRKIEPPVVKQEPEQLMFQELNDLQELYRTIR